MDRHAFADRDLAKIWAGLGATARRMLKYRDPQIWLWNARERSAAQALLKAGLVTAASSGAYKTELGLAVVAQARASRTGAQ